MHETAAQRIRYARIIAQLFGVFCCLMGLNELLGGLNLGFAKIPPRWDPAVVTFPVALRVESWFLIAYAGLLFLPWRRIESRRLWKGLFALLCVASFVFAFAMISEVMAKNYVAQAAGMKARIPVFQAVLLFLCLGQIPLELFSRKPELLD
jgi:drug/metabolite transporter (DMT)-like permease